MTRLRDKTAVVTGAGRGIGRALALGLGREGASVAVADVDLATAQATATELRESGGRALAVELDVSKVASARAMTRTVLAEFGQIDILINNAGVISTYPLLELPEAEWDRVLAVNLKGMFVCSQSVAAPMIERRQGAIVNISSVAGQVPTVDYAHYGASKAGVLHLTKSLAVALSRYNIRVNAIQPGTILSPMNADALADPAALAERLRLIPLGRVGTPEDVVAAAVFLASDEASYITGTTFHVDGGNACRSARTTWSE